MNTKIKPIEPYGPKWQALANSLARAVAPTIYACRKCNYPVLKGYCCETCGSSNPSTDEED